MDINVFLIAFVDFQTSTFEYIDKYLRCNLSR